jgi:hypothetical protein
MASTTGQPEREVLSNPDKPDKEDLAALSALEKEEKEFNKDAEIDRILKAFKLDA